MTTTLRKAFTKASRLPRAAQDQLAEQLLEDLCSEEKWDGALAKSQQKLDELASKALKARREGKTTAKGFDEL